MPLLSSRPSVVEGLESTSERIFTARDLILRHVRWKLTLQFAIASREPLSAALTDQIVHADRCPIGRWLASARAARLRSAPEFAEVVRYHLEFHREMMRVASLISGQEFEQAQSAIAPRSPFMNVSQRLAMSITALDRVERILAPADERNVPGQAARRSG